ncbi:MAG TPA: hypothetical protein VN132_00875, partial [Bdellovibrio sp.]|nr:hypothetical protein [Bdellovibrio sp.]
MKSWALILLFVAFATSVMTFPSEVFAKDGVKAKKDSKITPKKTIDIPYIDLATTFKTFDEYFAALEKLKFATAEETTAIRKFIEKKGVHGSDSISPEIYSENERKWGSVVLKYNKEQKSYQTALGYILRPVTGESVSQTFIRTYEALDGKCRNCSAMNVVLSRAYAGDKAEEKNNVSAVAELLWGNVIWPAFKTASGASGATLINVAGGISNVAKLILHPLRKALYDGHVVCNNGFYEMENVEIWLPSPNIVGEFMNEIEKIRTYSHDALPVPSDTDIAFGTMIDYGLQNVLNLLNFKDMNGDTMQCEFSKTGCSIPIARSILTDAFGGGVAPPCNNENLKKVKIAFEKKRAA